MDGRGGGGGGNLGGGKGAQWNECRRETQLWHLKEQGLLRMRPRESWPLAAACPSLHPTSAPAWMDGGRGGRML